MTDKKVFHSIHDIQQTSAIQRRERLPAGLRLREARKQGTAQEGVV